MQDELNQMGSQASKDVGQTMKTNGKWVSKESREAAKQAEGIVDQATQFATKTYDQVREASGEYLTNFNSSSTQFVRQYPLQTAVGALAVGFILGSIAFRRR